MKPHKSVLFTVVHYIEVFQKITGKSINTKVSLTWSIYYVMQVSVNYTDSVYVMCFASDWWPATLLKIAILHDWSQSANYITYTTFFQQKILSTKSKVFPSKRSLIQNNLW